MKISPEGREYLLWPIANAPAEAAVQVRFSGDMTWHPAERVDADSVRVLVAGPLATDNPAGAVVVTSQRTFVELRFINGAEVVIRNGGTVDLD